MLELAPTYGSVGFDRLPVVTPIAMEVGIDLIPLVEGSTEGELASAFRAMVTKMRGRLADRYGVQVPGIRVRGNTGDLPPASYIILLMEVPLVLGQVSLEKRFCTELPESVRGRGIQCEPASLAGWGSGSWIARADWDAAAAAGLTLWDAGE